MAQKAQIDVSDLDINMTPMIDVVFQLIIFLMLASDLSRKEIEDLTLPSAENSEEDKGILEKRRIIVNLLRGKNAGDPPILKVKAIEMNVDEFKRWIAPWADFAREKESPNAAELFVLIRADKGARWQDVQWVMQVCADPKIRIYKLQFAVARPKQERAGQ